MNQCTLCPRMCGVNRDIHPGFCLNKAQPRIARAALHYGEEPCISGTRGSGTVFFSGCNLRCKFCQNHPISHENQGKTVTVERLAEIFRELEEQGAHNINLVNPTHYAKVILEALDLYRPNVPIVYNTGGYERIEIIKQLDGYIDIYLPDCKYVSRELSFALSGVSDYFLYAAPAIQEMARQAGPIQLDGNGVATRGTMVRHLVLPGHTKDSMAVLDWLATMKDELWVSLLFQYTPMGDLTEHKELKRPLTKRECDKLWDYMESLGIRNGYVQDRTSSGPEAIPHFDLTGV